MEGQDVFNNKSGGTIEVIKEEKKEAPRRESALGGFSEQHLRKETIVRDFVAGKDSVNGAIDKPKKEVGRGDVVLESDSPIYVVFEDGIARGVDMVLEDPNAVEDLWNTLSQNPDYYNELLKRREIL